MHISSLFSTLLIFAVLHLSAFSQNSLRIPVRFCDPGTYEYSCNDLRNDLLKDPVLSNGALKFQPTGLQGNSIAHGILQCIPAHSSLDCVKLISEGGADMMRMDAETLFGLSTSRHYSSLLPVAAGVTSESCSSNSDCHKFVREYSVAVIRADSTARKLADLRDARPCYGEVGTTAGWTIPIYKLHANWTRYDPLHPIITKRHTRKLYESSKLIFSRSKRQPGQQRWKRQIYTNVTAYSKPNYNQNGQTQQAWESMNQIRCPVDLSLANDVFPSSCAPGNWANDLSFEATFSNRLCRNCAGTKTSCAASVPANDAFQCLKSEKGDVAFVSSKDIEKMLQNGGQDVDFASLCPIGRRRLMEYPYCHWGVIPEDVYVSRSRSFNGQSPKVYAQFIRRLFSHARSRDYVHLSFLADTSLVAEIKRLDDIRRHGGDLLSAKEYLSLEGTPSFYETMEGSFPKCANKEKMRLCVLSGEEEKKCQLMRIAFRSAALPASLECVVGYSVESCVKMITSNQADVAWMASHQADQYAHMNQVRPIMREEESEEEFALAVTMDNSRVTSLGVLNRDDSSAHFSACSAGTDSFAGWEAPNKVFKDLGIIRQDNCRLTEAWVKIFRSSCVPGATNVTVTLGRNLSMPISPAEVQKLCRGCGAMVGSSGGCLTPSEASDALHTQYDPYYGDVGALRCMVRRKGEVAFVKSSALKTIVQLKQELNEPDFRSISPSSFYLLCPDGKTRQRYSSDTLTSCNLGRVPNKWLIARKDVDAQQLIRWQDIWVAGVNRGRKNYDWLRTHVRITPGRTDHLLDLIFTNNTGSLERFPIANSSDTYFHQMAYKNWKSPFQCNLGLTSQSSTLLVLITVLASCFYFLKM